MFAVVTSRLRPETYFTQIQLLVTQVQFPARLYSKIKSSQIQFVSQVCVEFSVAERGAIGQLA